ncbi:adenine phosphoribosyltransferase 5-like [Henckelia pumila]|uniref:adenine phosphoribosyltransferase 5-like n=1 Tax=Henckelia pumila TaxID=405737 RepID=UPI003C6E4365
MFAAENGLKGDPRLQAISQAIRVIRHFPKPGIMFQDITNLLLNHKVFKDTVDILLIDTNTWASLLLQMLELAENAACDSKNRG